MNIEQNVVTSNHGEKDSELEDLFSLQRRIAELSGELLKSKAQQKMTTRLLQELKNKESGGNYDWEKTKNLTDLEFLSYTYHSLLHRPVDDDGFYKGMLVLSQGSPRGLIVDGIRQSEEFSRSSNHLLKSGESVVFDWDKTAGKSNLFFIMYCYHVILGRYADESGFQNILEALRRGTPREQIVDDLIQSEEHRSSGRKFFINVPQGPAEEI